MKLCKDCKWCVDPGKFAKCDAPGNVIESGPISKTGFDYGKKDRRWNYCEVHRGQPFLIDILFRSCGSRGRWWEPKP